MASSSNIYFDLLNSKLSAYAFALFIGHWERWNHSNLYQEKNNNTIDSFIQNLISEIRENKDFNSVKFESLLPEENTATQSSNKKNTIHSILQYSLIENFDPKAIENLLNLHISARPDLQTYESIKAI